jgi:signal transduction histidine kinase
MDDRNKRLLNIIIYFSLILTLSVTILTNLDNALKLLPLSILLIFSFSLRRKLTYGSSLLKVMANLSFIADIILIYFISLQDMSRVSQIYFYVLTIDAVIFYSIQYSLLFALITYSTYVFIRFIRYIKWNYFDFSYFSPAIYENALYFIFVFIIVYIAKRQITQSQVLAHTMNELEIKTRQLGDTNNKLQETLVTLEEMTVLKERNRIAREIHDTVGHTLTTVLIEIEAGKRLVSKKPELACEKLDLAQGQVRKGLNDIRQSVRTLHEGSDILSLIPSMQLLIKDTEIHAGVVIEFNFDRSLTISQSQGKVLFRALQEGLTNGIRHGNCTSFDLSLSNINDNISFCLKDNGLGCGEVSLGFGLTAMKERVNELGGELEINTSNGKGFCLNINLPFEKGETCEYYQNSYS